MGAFIALVLQYKLRVAPIFFIGEGLGALGIYQSVQEYDNGNLGEWGAIIMSILCLMVVIYSIWNYITAMNKGAKR